MKVVLCESVQHTSPMNSRSQFDEEELDWSREKCASSWGSSQHPARCARHLQSSKMAKQLAALRCSKQESSVRAL